MEGNFGAGGQGKIKCSCIRDAEPVRRDVWVVGETTVAGNARNTNVKTVRLSVIMVINFNSKNPGLVC